jgi:hypothetical protein
MANLISTLASLSREGTAPVFSGLKQNLIFVIL